jgi:hypothetical protein
MRAATIRSKAAVMDDNHWASFDFVFPDGEEQTLLCDLSSSEAIDQIIAFLHETDAKLIALANFMSAEIERLKTAKCGKGLSLFAAR